MGAPISAIIANLIMEFLEDTILKKLNFEPIFYHRYVDDIIICVPEHAIQNTIDEFNNFHDRLQFTIEIETDNKIPFLDVLIIKTENSFLEFDWFQKSTWSGRYLNFNSSLPQNYKRNTIRILSQKILQLSHHNFHTKNFDLLIKTLINNGYPKFFVINEISKLKSKFLNPISTIQNSNNIITNQIKFSGIPYFKGITEKINKILETYKIKLVGKPSNTLYRQIFSKLKDPIPLDQKHNVIYKIQCKDCNLCYIGESSQYIKKRIYDHKYHIKKGNADHSGLCKHALDSGHHIDWDNFKILDQESDSKKRKLLEAIHIKLNKDNMNIQEDNKRFPNTYQHLI